MQIHRKFGKEIIGKQMNNFTILDYANYDGEKKCKCLCNCGKIFYDTAGNIFRKGDRERKSCGCLMIEMRKNIPHETKYEPSIRTARAVWQTNYSDGDLTFEQFYKLSQMNCYYCGDPPENKANIFRTQDRYRLKKAGKEIPEFDENYRDGLFIYSGLDRVVSFKDGQKTKHDYYNCVPACIDCNGLKMNRNIKVVIEKAIKIVNHMGLNGMTSIYG